MARFIQIAHTCPIEPNTRMTSHHVRLLVSLNNNDNDNNDILAFLIALFFFYYCYACFSSQFFVFTFPPLQHLGAKSVVSALNLWSFSAFSVLVVVGGIEKPEVCVCSCICVCLFVFLFVLRGFPICQC